MSKRFDESNVNRVVAGNGDLSGTFATKGQTSADFGGLVADFWGSVDLSIGSRTPYGAADHIEHVADGIVFAGTPSHGSYKLSKERNAAIPAPLRRSWYEEDAESSIVQMFHPDAFPAVDQAAAEQSVKDWFPNEYEAATGRELLVGESHLRDEQRWTEAHFDDLVSHGVQGDPDRPGYVIVGVRHRGQDTNRRFRVPIDEHRTERRLGEPGQNRRIVIDPARHEELEPLPDKVLTPAPKYRGIQPGKTPAAQAQIKKDLDKLWRTPDGKVSSFRELLEEQGVTAKSSYFQGGRRTYTVSFKDHVEESWGHSYQVSKATWDALEAPDDRSPYLIALQEQTQAADAYEKLSTQRYTIGSDAFFRHQQQLLKAKEKATHAADRVAQLSKKPAEG
ncbi:DUF7007 domain-containing protein [Agromyces humi]|uniref:DUF7007 domain-containing protein n=1 Tax=Agromyces humi TaxID=1766800 RepID=UPI0013598FDB|nr:hypothetical protein [Agromyces humi]